MRVFYDTEFIEDGRTIDLISIGMVAEDGRELYRIVSDRDTITRAVEHPWLAANVVPHLPLITGLSGGLGWAWADTHPDYWVTWSRETVAREVRDFLTEDMAPIELWAWYGAYDHVALTQLFGPAVDRPVGVPMWTNDLQQEIARLGVSEEHLPDQPDAVHNALADARHAMRVHGFLTSVAEGRAA